jgi:hypothetical protein
MAFGGPAIFSNDPNIGIRQMGLDAFIPTPVSSLTYKSRAGVDARRRQNYQNAPTSRRSGPPHEVVTLPDGNQISVLLGGKKGKKPSSTMFAGASVPKPGQFGYGGPAPVARPTIGAPRLSEVADGIRKLQNELRQERSTFQYHLDQLKDKKSNAADAMYINSLQGRPGSRPIPGVIYA